MLMVVIHIYCSLGVDGLKEDWYSYSYYSLDAGENEGFPDAYTCKGHASDDPVLPTRLSFTPGFMSLADSDGDGVISNWEYFVAVDPNNMYGADYVYDNFEWDHCSDGRVDTVIHSAPVNSINVDPDEPSGPSDGPGGKSGPPGQDGDDGIGG
jgi:hypothetical protein